MKSIFYFILFSFIILRTLSLGAEVIDKIVASIDGDPVTEDEVRSILSLELDSKPTNDLSNDSNSKENLNKQLLKEAIITMLFEREAKRLQLNISPEEVSRYIAQVEQANNAEEGTLLNALREQGISFDSYERKIRNEMLRSKVLTAELRNRIQITDEEIDEYLGIDASSEESDSNDNVFSLVMVSFINRLKNQEDDAKSTIDTMRKLINETKSCSSISSHGGFCENLGELEFKDLKSDLQELLKSKSNFEASDIIESNSEYVFYFKAPKSFTKENSKIKEEIRQKLYQNRFQQEAEKYLKEDLFNKYHVEFHES